ATSPGGCGLGGFRGLPPVPVQTPALGRHAGGIARFDALVVPDGVGTWSRLDAGATLAGMVTDGPDAACPPCRGREPGALTAGDGSPGRPRAWVHGGRRAYHRVFIGHGHGGPCGV